MKMKRSPIRRWPSVILCSGRLIVRSIVAAIFLPVTFISGVFGMNVAGLPGVEDINSFWIVSGVMLTVSVAILIGLRWKKWF